MRLIYTANVYDNFFSDYGVESDEKINCTKNYEPVFKMPTNSLRKKTKFYTNKKKRNLEMVKTSLLVWNTH